jgi:CRISPR/Cas system-associated exonuclease Cas4 (RecB family)
MGDFKNEFSWSKSRDEVFQACKREYFFQHYGFWGGWEEGSPAREIYILKKLTTRHAWIGEVAHQFIKKILIFSKAGMLLPLSQLLHELRQQLAEEFNFSKTKGYWQYPKKTGLFEHEYDVPLTQDEWNETFKLAENAVTQFYNSDTLRRIKGTSPKNWIYPEEFSHFDFEGIKVNVQLDFAIKESDSGTIYDWKTGKEASSDAAMRIQLPCYALYASQKWKLPPDKITVRIYNPRLEKEETFSITEEDIINVKRYMRNSIAEMKASLADLESNSANIEDFPETENKRRCQYCKFKRLCVKS